MPSTEVFLYDVRVQGKGSVEEIVSGIEYFQTHCDVEVIIIGRGGGSLEDLWSFNEEKVVRATFSSRIPIISAVGHEVDTSLSDLAADVRAPTPTAAGEMVVPKRSDLLQELERFESRLQDYVGWFYPYAQRVDDQEERLRRVFTLRIERHRSQLEKVRADLGNMRPDRCLALLRNQLFQCETRLRDLTARRVGQARGELDSLSRRFLVHDPRQTLRAASERLDFVRQRAGAAIVARIRDQHQRIGECARILEALNVDRVLRRGFSLVERDEGFVRSARELHKGESIRIRFSEGSAGATITTVAMEPENRNGADTPLKKGTPRQKTVKEKKTKEGAEEPHQECLF